MEFLGEFVGTCHQKRGLHHILVGTGCKSKSHLKPVLLMLLCGSNILTAFHQELHLTLGVDLGSERMPLHRYDSLPKFPVLAMCSPGQPCKSSHNFVLKLPWRGTVC